MPHHVNFDELINQISDITVINVNVNGWRNPLKIEYVCIEDCGVQVYWRIKGTTHTFTISLNELNKISKGDYKKHFEEFLIMFRDDLLLWTAEGLKEKWMREYLFQYKNYLVI